MSEMQDLTPQERVDSEMLARVLGERSGCGCSDTWERGRHDAELEMRQNRPQGCGVCGSCDDGDERVCGFGVEGGVVAAVYVPMQMFDEVYDMATAMRRGTMFQALDKPFYGDGREVDCRGREK